MVNLAVLAQGGVLYVDVLESGQGLRATANIGALDALHSTALRKSKSMLALMPLAEQQACSRRAGWSHLPAHTETDPARLREAIERAAHSGYAIDDEENELGMRCVLPPIRQLRRLALRAIGVHRPVLAHARTTRSRASALVRRPAPRSAVD